MSKQWNFVAVQSLRGVWVFANPWTAACQASLPFTVSQSLLKLMTVELMMPSNHLILCHPVLLLPSVFPSISVFSNESTLRIRWPKYWSFSFSISPSNEYAGLISFRMNCFGLAAQRTLKSLPAPQFERTVLRHFVFFMVQLSYPYLAAGKTMALIIWTFVGKVMSLVFEYAA